MPFVFLLFLGAHCVSPKGKQTKEESQIRERRRFKESQEDVAQLEVPETEETPLINVKNRSRPKSLFKLRNQSPFQ